MHMLSEQNDQGYRGQVSQMVSPVQETAKPVQPSWLLAGKINEMLAGEKTTTQPLSDPRVVVLMPQLSRAKVRVELAVDYRLLVSISPENHTIVFKAI